MKKLTGSTNPTSAVYRRKKFYLAANRLCRARIAVATVKSECSEDKAVWPASYAGFRWTQSHVILNPGPLARQSHSVAAAFDEWVGIDPGCSPDASSNDIPGYEVGGGANIECSNLFANRWIKPVILVNGYQPCSGSLVFDRVLIEPGYDLVKPCLKM